jgi:tRNA1Val (adenine37-N6)-methyltransferase
MAQEETVDSILGGALRIVQPRDGYRFALDSILLSRFAGVRSRDRVLELGAGCGVISAILASVRRPREIVAIELQPALAQAAARTAALNRLDNVRVVQGDLRARRLAGAAPASFDFVIANPPYRAAGSGRESPNLSRRIARGGAGATLAEFLAAARRYAADRGRVAIVFDATRSAELIAQLAAHALEPKRMRFVHPLPGVPASSVLIEARKGGRSEATVEAPLIVHTRPGIYSDEARYLLNDGIPRDGGPNE